MRLVRLLPLVLLLATACGRGSRPEGRSVVLVTLDTVRADAFGEYGRAAARTPCFDRWARSGTLVRWAIADAPLTLPSHSTILTGTPALGHGVRTNVHHRLGGEAETLAEVFEAAGYRTGAIVSTRVLAAGTGIDQGFRHFDDQLNPPEIVRDPARYPPSPSWLPPNARHAEEAVRLAEEWIDDGGDAPFFLWLHLFDPHSVYDPPPPWESVEESLYHAEVDWTDSQLHRLARALDRPGREDVVLLVVADHGEGLDDHREEEHGLFVYDEIVRVPLLVRARGIPAGAILDDQVRTMDLASTMLELAGRPERLGLGGSLVPALTGTGSVPGSVAYSEALRPRTSHSGSALKSLRTRDRKFVWAPQPEVYDLAADPGETRNLAVGDGELVQEWLARLTTVVAETRAEADRVAEVMDRDADELAALRSLGYTAGPRDAVADSLIDELSVAGLDPKDFIDVAMAGRDLEMGWPDRAEFKLARFLAGAPDSVVRPEARPLVSTAHQNLALLAMRRGEYDVAAEHYRDAVEFSPANEAAREGRIRALNLGGRGNEALREVDAYLLATPADERLHLHRAFSLLLLGRPAEARAEAERIAAAGKRPDVVPVAEMLAEQLREAGTPDVLALYLTPR